MSWQDQREMTPAQFVAAFEALGLTQSEAARFLGMSDRQGRRLVRGQRHIATPIVLLLNGRVARGDKPKVPPWVPGSY